MKIYVVTEDGVDGTFAAYLRQEDAKEFIENNSGFTLNEETLNTGGEPIFVLRGQDMFATSGVIAYEQELRDHHQYGQAEEVQKALGEMFTWQDEHTDRLKNPDHEHVPASLPPSEDYAPAERTGNDCAPGGFVPDEGAL